MGRGEKLCRHDHVLAGSRMLDEEVIEVKEVQKAKERQTRAAGARLGRLEAMV